MMNELDSDGQVIRYPYRMIVQFGFCNPVEIGYDGNLSNRFEDAVWNNRADIQRTKRTLHAVIATHRRTVVKAVTNRRRQRRRRRYWVTREKSSA